jgi:FkbM family methyltransferase
MKNELQLLHKHLELLQYSFCENALESTLKVNNFLPVYFDNKAGGKVAGGSYSWIKNKHSNGSIHEPSTIAAFAFIRNQYLNRINVIFDIGALYGYFSLLSKSMFPKSTVFGFEMNPESYAGLCKNIQTNKHLGSPACHGTNIGLSDETMLGKHVHINKFQLSEEPESVGGTKLNILSMDDFCAISGFLPDLIKIDVEGYQAKIIPGAMNTIREAKPIILLEFDGKSTLQPFNKTNMMISEPLFDLGYRCYWCKDQRSNKGKFEPLTSENRSDKYEVNSLALFLPG